MRLRVAPWLGLALLLPGPVDAHPGGLNASGCHTNRKTGEYHCHGGVSPSTAPPSGGIVAPWSSVPPRPSAAAVSLLSIGDGDTIRVTTSDGRKVTIRLACIDAPETAQRPSGAESRAVLSRLVRSGPLQIKPQATDRYGRTVAEVFAGGLNVNLEMVRLGAAFAYRQYLGACDRSTYLAAEAQAHGQRLGVWSAGVQKLWEFRAQRRQRWGHPEPSRDGHGSMDP